MPPKAPLSIEQLFKEDKASGLVVPDMTVLRAHLTLQGKIDYACAMKILSDAKEVFNNEPNCLTVHSPMVAIGDIHG